ncbi:MAG: IPT/TIG domain-containing protein, partial [Candidatus Hydrogenedentes bacterium]|nr:IPT/TIG domain-containing protein [Candidatus Hydrogenedentota bacterium]
DPFLGEQDPFDLSYSQITFRPVGPPPAPLGEPAVGVNYNAYEASTCVVRELPVKRVDAQGGGYTLTPLNPAALLELPLGDMRFPFFGKEYDKVYISVNGYIVFEDFFRALEDYDLSGIDLFDGGDEDEYSIQEILDSPNIAGHFMLPRISFLFSLLRFTDGGQAWGRILSDRLVVTFENAVELFYNPYSSPTRNTVQVELFFSGQIRFTYLDSFVYYGLVGISDGQGAPVDPTGVFDNVEPAFGLTPFVHLPCAPSQLSINPVTPPVVSFGEDAMFTADASTPEGIGLPFFMGQWNNFGEAPFADLGDGSGKFLWATDYEDIGAHTVRVTAQVDNMQAYQDVRVVVQDKVVLPSAVNLLLSTDTLDEDPSVSRPIPPGRPLIASYVYYHPYSEQSPLEYAEGIYMLYWLRNGQVVSALTNSLQVPANIPQPGERWSFQITPITVTMLFGAPADSPVVTVMAVPEIEGITPVQGLTIGGDTVTVRGKYLDDLLFVKFGDVPATSIRIVNDEEVEVITPLHVAGKVTVSVETLSGIGRSIDSFSFVGDQDDPVNEGEGEEEKERRILGCGNSENSGSSKGLDLLLFGIVVFVLLLAARRPRAISDGYCD